MTPAGTRAAPLSPEDRRAAILRATVPLLRERGANVTTRELATACGVAEGTLFRVFRDKDALVRAAVAHALDPAPLLAALAGIDPQADLRTALTEATAMLMARSRDVGALLAAWHGPSGAGAGAGAGEASGQPHADAPGAQGSEPLAGGHHGGHDVRPHGPMHAPHAEGHPVNRVAAGVAALLRRYPGELRQDPDLCGRLLVGLVLSTRSAAPLGTGPDLTAAEIVSIFLDGVHALSSVKEYPC